MLMNDIEQLHCSKIRALPHQYQCMIFHLLRIHQDRIHTQMFHFRYYDSPRKENKDLSGMDLFIKSSKITISPNNSMLKQVLVIVISLKYPWL